MVRLTQWLVLLVAPVMLTSCLLVPAKFTSTLDIRADRSFTFSYVGEVQMLKSGQSDQADPEGGTEGFDQDQGADEGPDTEVRLWAIAAKQGAAKEDRAAPKPDDDFADSDDDSAKLQRLATTLAGEYGYRSVRYIGNRTLAIDYRITGKLDHAFVFPFNPDGEVLIPFLAIELRGKDRVRVKAPGFANDQSASSGMGGMGGLGGMPGGDDPGALLDGTFTLTTDAPIVSQNQENGPQDQPGGAKKIVWTVNPESRDAPMAVLRVQALP